MASSWVRRYPEAAVWFVPPGLMVSTQEELACSAHARPTEVALTRLTVHRPGQVSVSLVALPRCGEAPPLL